MAEEAQAVVSTVKRGEEISAEELDIAFEGPAPLANRFFITTDPSGVRIAFAEQRLPSPPVFRNAVVLSYQNAIQLRDLLTTMLVDVEKQISAAEAQAKAPSDG